MASEKLMESVAEKDRDGWQARSSGGLFGSMLVISLFIHAVCAGWLAAPGNRVTARNAAVPYVDMTWPAEPATSALPLPRNLPDPSPSPPPPTELARFQERVQQTRAAASAEPALMGQDSLGLGMTSGYFSSLAEGKTLRDDVREYYLAMLREVNEKWWVEGQGRFRGARGAVINVILARNGAIVRTELAVSSGDRTFDRAILQSLEAANPLPPLPATFQGEYFTAPLRFVAPLGLMQS